MQARGVNETFKGEHPHRGDNGAFKGEHPHKGVKDAFKGEKPQLYEHLLHDYVIAL
ncbi:hypothetical protein DPMN_162022 [Dreissena polymorpha]|uniref:Uncharacterized protein n=1 Tax=Dreissena polymorpha TaxID=45954 RepID=A0A9D4IQ68_DREPO|nr:hypothetical protein DPMN_162022 [Dreissena polymorpha]